MNIVTTRLLAVVLLAGLVLAGLLGVSLFAGSRAGRPVLGRGDAGAGPTPTALPTHRTIALEGETVAVDFRQCTGETMRVSVTFGSTTLKVVGRDGDVCLLDYGGEVENPNWDGKLDHRCRIPTQLGLVRFGKKELGIDLTAIQRYCGGPISHGAVSSGQ